MIEERHGIASADGAEIHYSTAGSGPTCLVPSAIGAEPYREMTTQLAERFRLVYVELRGSGRSTGEPADLTFDLLAEDLEAVRRELDADRVAVLGHSVLGVLALESARRRPETLSHVIVAGTPPIGDMAEVAALASAFFQEKASDERQRVLRDNLAALSQEASMGETMLAHTPMRFYDPRFDAASLFRGALPDRGLLMHLMTTLVAGWSIRDDPASLHAPIFIAHGRFDFVVPHVLWSEVVELLPDATLRVFDRSGHQPFLEEPNLFADAVARWMANRER